MVNIQTLSFEVLEPESFEERSNLLTQVRMDLDEAWASSLPAALESLATRLETVPQPLPVSLAAYARILANDARTRGALGLATPSAPWSLPMTQVTLEAQGQVDGLTLRTLFPDQNWALDLGDALESHADLEPLNYGRDVVASGLIEACENLDSGAGALSAIRAIEQAVAQAPRKGGRARRSFAVGPQDTLESLALAVYGSRQDAHRLARDLELYPPYLSPTRRPGCLSPGDTLLDPSYATPLERDPLGSTFALDATPAHGGQEWDLVALEGGGIAFDSGLQGLSTDLALRSVTPLGSLSGEEDYGMVPLAGLSASSAGLLTYLLSIETLYADPRVGSIAPRVLKQPNPARGVLVGDLVVYPRPDLVRG